MDDRVFLLAETDERIDVQEDNGAIFISCGTLLTRHGADQLQLGLRAVLSGNFSRACSQSFLEFDLARRTRRVDSTVRIPSIKPELDML